MRRLRPPTVRLRLTLLYGALFFVSGAALLVITYLLFRDAAAPLGVHIESEIEPAPALGNAALAERLVRNLIDNAVHHNVPRGRVWVRTGTGAGGAFLAVANDGAVIPAAEMERLFEPFQRLGTDRTTPSDGHHGLGLSIVRAIATVPGGTLHAEARPDGGLAVEVALVAADYAPTP